MKKIVFMVIVALCATFASQPVQAQEVQGNSKENTTGVNDKFYQIETTDIPQILLQAINNSYDGCQVEDVYVSNNSTFVKYKVILMTREQKKLKVYLDDKGVVVNENAYAE